MRVGFDVRSYGAASDPHRHDFIQLVLPLSGGFAIDVDGAESGLSPGFGAFVASGMRHTQEGQGPNRSLIVDLAPDLVPQRLVDRLGEARFVRLAPSAGKLVDYIGAALAACPGEAVTAHWLPLLLDALETGSPPPRARLAELLAAVAAAPERMWTVAEMASRAALSVPRLHAVFRAELGTTPHAWLAEMRLNRAIRELEESDLPIVEVACRGGYADQSAFTRAMRKATGATPAAHRRAAREPGPKQR